MAESLFSPSWYRVKLLKPQLRRHARIHRHFYRGRLWYVLQDPTSGRLHRFNPAAHTLIGLMDGRRSVQEIWELASTRLGDDMPTQDEVIQLLAKLHQADVLQCDVAPDTAELFHRFEQTRQRQLKQRFSGPLAIKIPLYDPDRLVGRLIKYLYPLFNRFGFLLWAVVVLTGLVLAASHWPELTDDVIDRVLAAENLMLLWITFPLVKALHEFGHALAVKRWGGEVHEIGIMLLVFMPVPYVDASSASAFADKHRRIIVGAAGMMVEFFIAAIAMILWINLEPGFARATAFNTMLIAGVSTLLFNANPLLRFDGYYILADYLETPNLANRANQYLGYLAKKYIFKLRSAEPQADSIAERGWYVFYSIASFGYRMVIMVVIVLFVAGKFFVIGVIVAVWASYRLFLMPMVKPISHVLFSAQMQERRSRSVAILFGLIVTLILVLVALPVPMWTRAEGVIRVPEDSSVRAGSGGFVEHIVARPNQVVERGTPLLILKDPELEAQVKILAAQLDEAETRYYASLGGDRAEAEVAKQEINRVRTRLLDARRRLARLVLRSPADGVFVLPKAADLPGRYISRGSLLGYVLDYSDVIARVVIDQGDVDLIRRRTTKVELRLAERIAEVVEGRITREVPAATNELPSLALSMQAGGKIAVDPRQPGQQKSLQTLFVFDIALPAHLRVRHIGQRVQVRFDHGWSPLAWQAYRKIRQLFLSRFNV